jgi:hypothetical protein
LGKRAVVAAVILVEMAVVKNTAKVAAVVDATKTKQNIQMIVTATNVVKKKKTNKSLHFITNS